MTIKTDNQGRKYQIWNGTAYHPDTSRDVIRVLEDLRMGLGGRRRLVRIYTGDTENGIPWAEEFDVIGRIGRSTGPIKIPLLVPSGEHGGFGLLDNRILRICYASDKSQVLYEHPKYIPPEVTIEPWDEPEYPYNVHFNGELHARCKTLKKAEKLKAHME